MYLNTAQYGISVIFHRGFEQEIRLRAVLGRSRDKYFVISKSSMFSLSLNPKRYKLPVHSDSETDSKDERAFRIDLPGGRVPKSAPEISWRHNVAVTRVLAHRRFCAVMSIDGRRHRHVPLSPNHFHRHGPQ